MENLKKNILDGMLDFIEGDADADYSAKEVQECDELLSQFQITISNITPNIEAAMPEVKSLILKLNELNSRCDECLIETDQREQICEFIDLVLKDVAIPVEGDITEEWREW